MNWMRPFVFHARPRHLRCRDSGPRDGLSQGWSRISSAIENGMAHVFYSLFYSLSILRNIAP